MILNSVENKWIQDKYPQVNSGYPILASMKYKGIFTNEATDIKEKSADLQGTITIKNEKNLQKGFEYKAEDSSQFIIIFVDSEEFSYELTNLTPRTKYEYRAFAVTNKGKITGQEIEFYTLHEKCDESCGHKHHD
jgi:hypothetical protein